MRKVIFLDRDGVINKENKFTYRIEDFQFIEGVFDSCLSFLNKGYELIIITNQSGIGRGFYTENDFIILNNWMLQMFNEKHINILDVLYCPHHPNANCNCRKPAIELFEKANEKYQIDKVNSWMIGDKESDMQAAQNFGISNTILVQSGHKVDIEKSKAKFVFPSILEASEFIS